MLEMLNNLVDEVEFYVSEQLGRVITSAKVKG